MIPRGSRRLWRSTTWALIGLAWGLVGTAALAVPDAHEPDPAAGRRLYREGIRPSGEPVTAIVTRDVPVLGTQFSCQSCHGRSGMGAAEGAYVVPAIAGPLLFAPSHPPRRPAYDRDSLARALREGIDASGRPLDSLMPRYTLTDDEVADLAAYLASLPTGPSPGIDDKAIRIATVVTDDVAPDVRDALLEVLRTFADEKNRQTRLEGQRPNRGKTPESRLPTLFREWALEEWTLTGPSEGWSEQLEEHYRRAPVFILLGGSSASTWGPIGRFCERHEIPCLLPETDWPDARTDDFYTLYFSRGLDLEADLIASHLAAHPVPSAIQVFCGATAARAADSLRTTLTQAGVSVESLELACDDGLPVDDLASRLTAAPDAAVVLWLRRPQLTTLESRLPPGRVYLSSTLLEGDLEAPLPSARGPIFVAHPFRLPDEPDSAMARFTLWARTRGIEIRHPRIQAEAFFACLVANDAFTHLRRYLVRDYVLDMLDHAQGLAAYLPLHARPTLGPDQRFLTKGGYVLPIVDGRPETEGAVWIVP